MHIGAHRGSERFVYDWLGKEVIWIEANPIIFSELKKNLIEFKYQIEAMAVILLALSVLMLSNFRYYSFKTINLKKNVSFFGILIVFCAYVIIAITVIYLEYDNWFGV